MGRPRNSGRDREVVKTGAGSRAVLLRARRSESWPTNLADRSPSVLRVVDGNDRQFSGRATSLEFPSRAQRRRPIDPPTPPWREHRRAEDRRRIWLAQWRRVVAHLRQLGMARDGFSLRESTESYVIAYTCIDQNPTRATKKQGVRRRYKPGPWYKRLVHGFAANPRDLNIGAVAPYGRRQARARQSSTATTPSCSPQTCSVRGITVVRSPVTEAARIFRRSDAGRLAHRRVPNSLAGHLRSLAPRSMATFSAHRASTPAPSRNPGTVTQDGPDIVSPCAPNRSSAAVTFRPPAAGTNDFSDVSAVMVGPSTNGSGIRTSTRASGARTV
jgi:hypothetical protein